MNCNIDELFEFEDRYDGYCLAKYLLKDDPFVTEINIPSEYRGKPVLDIGTYAFKSAKYLKKAIIADGVAKICFGAFEDCENLEEAYIPASVTGIYAFVFERCSRLKKIRLPEGLETLELTAFGRCSELREINIPPALSKINVNTFEYCRSLEKIYISEGLRKIDKFAFMKCTSLKELILPQSVESLEWCAFYDCTALETVIFPQKSIKVDNSFLCCANVCTEAVMASLCGSSDITLPFKYYEFTGIPSEALRTDVFLRALECGSFFMYTEKEILKGIIGYNRAALLPIVSERGWLSDRKTLDETIALSSEKGSTECTAWLLEYKHKAFGFEKTEKFDLR